jgi:hypothetical protein
MGTAENTPGIAAVAAIASTAGFGEENLAALDEIEGNHVEWNRRVGDVLELDMTRYQPAQASIGDKVVAPSAQPADEGAHTDRKDVLALQSAPDTCEVGSRLDGLPARRHEGRVQRAGGRSNEQIGGDPALVDRPQHADLNRRQAGAA